MIRPAHFNLNHPKNSSSENNKRTDPPKILPGMISRNVLGANFMVFCLSFALLQGGGRV